MSGAHSAGLGVGSMLSITRWESRRSGRIGLLVWVKKTLDENTGHVADFRAVRGRLGFTAGPLDFLQPFLSFLYKVTLPWAAAFLLRYIASKLSMDRRCTSPQGPLFRGEGCGQARWFAMALDRENAPWAFSRGEPHRTIASIELHLTGLTDHAGHTSALSRPLSSTCPLVIVTEMSAQLQAMDEEYVVWIARNQNEQLSTPRRHDLSRGRSLRVSEKERGGTQDEREGIRRVEALGNRPLRERDPWS